MLRSKVQKGKNNTTCWYDYQPFQGASSPFGPPELGRDDYISRTDFADTIRGWLGAAHEWMVKRRTHRILEKVHWSGTDYRASWLGEEFMEVSYFCSIFDLSHFTASVIFSVCCETFPVCCETFLVCCETFPKNPLAVKWESTVYIKRLKVSIELCRWSYEVKFTRPKITWISRSVELSLQTWDWGSIFPFYTNFEAHNIYYSRPFQ